MTAHQQWWAGYYPNPGTGPFTVDVTLDGIANANLAGDHGIDTVGLEPTATYELEIVDAGLGIAWSTNINISSSWITNVRVTTDSGTATLGDIAAQANAAAAFALRGSPIQVTGTNNIYLYLTDTVEADNGGAITVRITKL